MLRSLEQQQCASPASGNAGYEQRDQYARRRVQPLEIGDGAGRRAGPQSDCVGRVGGYCGDAGRNNNAGNEMKLPPPASAFSAPAIPAAMSRKMAWLKCKPI